MDRLVCYTAVFSGKERCVTTLRTAVYIRLWIGLLLFFKGSLTWENNAIFSSHCFTLRQCRNSTINSERDHNLKPLKTDISTIVPSFDAMFGAWTGVQASPLSDLPDHVGFLNQQKCVEDQFSWFESLGGLLCSTTVLGKRSLCNESIRKRYYFQRKISLVRLLTFNLFQIDFD